MIKEWFSLLFSDTELKSCVCSSSTGMLPSCHHETPPASRHTTSSFKQMNMSCFVSAQTFLVSVAIPDAQQLARPQASEDDYGV